MAVFIIIACNHIILLCQIIILLGLSTHYFVGLVCYVVLLFPRSLVLICYLAW